jgi:two-component system response regulator HydG
MNQTNILIVDDNIDLADGLEMVLEDEGYHVSLAYNGTDAINVFDKEHFDYAFVDVSLPDMNGMQVFKHIHNKDPKVKVIMMTGFRIEQVLAEIIEHGDVEILTKPFEINHIFELVEKMKHEGIVLIADDDPDFSESLSEYLNEQGLTTMLARNGKEAVDAVLSNPISVLVLDLRMSIMNGLEVYLKLKELGHTVKTIIVTGYAQEEADTIDILRSVSVTGCLFKPFKPEAMLHAIQHAIIH